MVEAFDSSTGVGYLRDATVTGAVISPGWNTPGSGEKITLPGWWHGGLDFELFMLSFVEFGCLVDRMRPVQVLFLSRKLGQTDIKVLKNFEFFLREIFDDDESVAGFFITRD